MERRVVITGLGVVSPVGNHLDTFWVRLVAGKSGIQLIDEIVTEEDDCKIGVQGNDFEPVAVLASHQEVQR